jgi:hypothetical protein
MIRQTASDMTCNVPVIDLLYVSNDRGEVLIGKGSFSYTSERLGCFTFCPGALYDRDDVDPTRWTTATTTQRRVHLRVILSTQIWPRHFNIDFNYAALFYSGAHDRTSQCGASGRSAISPSDHPFLALLCWREQSKCY